MKTFKQITEEFDNRFIPKDIDTDVDSFIFSRIYKTALERLIDLVDEDVTKKHGLYFWATEVAKQNREIDIGTLISLYLSITNEGGIDEVGINEVLNPDDSLSTWITDFQKSDAPQFKGKTKEQRKKMAIAAYLSAKRINDNKPEINERFTKEIADSLFENKNELTEDESQIIYAIWENTLSSMFAEPLDQLLETNIDTYINLITEEIKGIPDDAKVVFGKVIKDGKQIGVVKDERFVPIEHTPDNIDKTKASVKNVFKKLKQDVISIAADLGESKENIVKAFSQPDVKNALKKVGYSVKAAGFAIHKTVGLLNSTLAQSFQEIEKAGGLDKLKKGTQKIDDFLDKHPNVKKLGGPLVAGALVYQWQNMSFSGDFNDDFDVTSIIDAIAGDYSVHDLTSTSSGAKALTQLAVGLATGGTLTFPWKLGITTALAYTGAKKTGEHGLAEKALDKLKELKRKYKPEIQTESVNTPEEMIHKLLTSPENAKIIDAINDGKKNIVFEFIQRHIKDKAKAKQILNSIFS